MRIKLDTISRDDFNVTEREGKFLIVPKKSKHRWDLSEIHLRSLVTDADGYVLSSGFPKFFNYGEMKEVDQGFLRALRKGKVTLTEKRDGSLALVDLNDIEEGVTFRTRGQHALGVFEEPVLDLFYGKYGGKLDTFLLRDWPDSQRFTYLFEYTAPENRIVVPYKEPSLTFLGVVDKMDLSVHYAEWIGRLLEQETGIPTVRLHEIPGDWEQLRDTVQAWQDCEGVVARWDGPYGGQQLLKIKSLSYVRLHALKFKMTKPGLLAYLLGIETEADIFPRLSSLGVDYEGVEFVKDAFTDYCAAVREAREEYGVLAARVAFIAESAESRKAFVEEIRRFLFEHPTLSTELFSAAMLLYDGKTEDAWKAMLARIVGESPNTLRTYEKNKQGFFDDLIKSGAEE